MLLLFTKAIAQKELWGYRTNTHADGYPNLFPGEIIRIPLDFLGTSFQEAAQVITDDKVMHTFDATSVQGKYPYGRLLQASNEKLYGMTSYMRDTFITEIPSNSPFSVLFEYDLILNKYRVVHSFTRVINTQIDYRAQHRIPGLIEISPGIIIGIDQQSRIFKFNLNTGLVNIVKTFTPFTAGGFNYITSLQTEFMKANNGNLYAAIDFYQLPGSNVSSGGGFIKYNYTTNSHQFIENTTGAFPNSHGRLVVV